MANHYDVPNWAGKPSPGLHLDVMKETKMIQKLMIDEKKCYLFGRNAQLNDFCIDHASCSRVHAALVYHKHLNRAFLVDLGSTHGTYIGNVRIEGNKPTPLLTDSTFHFGASTRRYMLRERPQTAPRAVIEELEESSENADGALLGLPETETELDNLTEFNTAHNRRITMMGIPDDEIVPSTRKRKKHFVFFNDEEEIINPEDIDPTVGKFRNLVQTTVLVNKRPKTDPNLHTDGAHRGHGMHQNFVAGASVGLYGDLPPEQNPGSSIPSYTILSGKLGLSLPNPAPEVDLAPPVVEITPTPFQFNAQDEEGQDLPKKKKYAKEAWPGKKPTHSLLV